jgi:hypothetical protein
MHLSTLSMKSLVFLALIVLSTACDAPQTAAQMYAWCSSDVVCERAYYQLPDANQTVFEALLDPDTYLSHAAWDLTTDCAGARQVALMQMLAGRANSPLRCPPLQRIEFDADSLAFSCECVADGACNDDVFNAWPMWFGVGIVSANGIIIAGTLAWRNWAVVSALKRTRHWDHTSIFRLLYPRPKRG